MSERLKELLRAASDLESKYAVTTWLKAESACGETGYHGVRTNSGWCREEVRRLEACGVDAFAVRFGFDIAVFRRPSPAVAAEIVGVYAQLERLQRGA